MNGVKNVSLNKKSSAPVKFLVGAAIFLFFLFVINFFNSGIKNIFYVFSSPIQKTFWTAGETCSGFLNSFSQSESLKTENQNLKNENQNLLAEVATLQSIQQGNQAQSDVSVACQNNGFKLLMAGVSGLNNNDVISINKGSADGVAAGMPVITQQNALFGKVLNVYKNYSDVILISNKSSVINVKVQQSDFTKPEIDGVIKGQGGLNVFLDLVPIDDTINQGDILLTSSLDGTFPKNLLIGKITNIKKNDQDPHQSAQVQPFFNIATDNLFIITNYKK